MKNIKGWSDWYYFKDLYAFNGVVDPKSQSGMVTTIDNVKGGLAKWNGFLDKEGSEIYFENEQKLESRAKIPCGIYMMRIEGKLPKNDPPKSGFYDYIGLAGGIMNKTWRCNGFNSRLPDDHFRKLINIPQRGDVIAALKKAYPKDIFDRPDALQKLAKQNFSCYAEYREFFKGNYHIENNFRKFFKYNHEQLNSTKDVQDFFNNNVRIRFNVLERNIKNSSGKYIRYENIYAKGNLRNEVLQGNKDSLEESEKYHNQEREFQKRLNKAEGLSLQAYFTKYDEYPFLNDRNEVSYALKGFKSNLDD